MIAEPEAVALLERQREEGPCAFPGAFERLHRRITAREARVAVMGLGYVGLPLALAYAEGGFRTAGIDIDARRVSALRAGRSPLTDVADAEVAGALESGRFSASSEVSALAEADCIVICVPTPLRKTREPDISAIVAACRAIRKSEPAH